jgi:UDP-2,4-diacetamido-2,4,6-trideoxy-beta-L-altropyranose hydrolase
MQRILFRADGNRTIGFGHVYRTLALAGMLNNDFECVFAINRPDGFIKDQISKVCQVMSLDTEYNYPIPDKMTTQNQLPYDLQGVVREDDIVVVDGYHFGAEYQQGLKNTGCKQVWIDDLLRDYPFADAVINHAVGIEAAQYNTNARLALGLEYAILRKPFFSPLKPKDYTNKVAYISLGGSDYFGFTLKICKGLLATNSFNQVHILCSAQFEEGLLSDLRQLAETYPITLHFNLSAEQIVEVMDVCTHAFVSASTVLIESYSRGLKCFAGYYTQNQHLIYNGFIKNQLASAIGDFNTVTEQDIKNLVATDTEIKVLDKPLNSQQNFIKLFRSI